MPLHNPAPNFALLSSFDARNFSGVDLFIRDSAYTVTMPTFIEGDGVYEDVLFFLNGRQSNSAIYGTGQLIADGFGGTSWLMNINASDHVEIKAPVEFTITLIGATDSLGFGNTTIGSTLIDSVYIATAPNDWRRGLVDLSTSTYRIDEVGGGGSFTFPTITPDSQDVTVFARSSESDKDDFNLLTLQTLDNSSRSSNDITWSINDNGFIQCHYRSALGNIEWSSDKMRDLLGFSGNETPIVENSVSRLTATYQSDSILLPTRPIQATHLNVENISQRRRKIGGGYSSNFIGSYVSTILNFDLDAALDTRDDYRHFTNKFIRLISGGERINFYQCWGDSRRALRNDEIRGNQSAYDKLYTSELNGERGRLRGCLVTDEFNLSYPSRLHRRVPVTMEIEHI